MPRNYLGIALLSILWYLVYLRYLNMQINFEYAKKCILISNINIRVFCW